MNKLHLSLAIIRYIISFPVSVAASIFVWLTCWFWAALSFTTKDGNLPKWCYWLQTHDNPLDSLWIGGEGQGHRERDYDSYKWLYKHSNEEISNSFWLKYFARMFWLIRNPAYGVANALGMSRYGTVDVYSKVGSCWDFTVFETPEGETGFLLNAHISWLFNRYVRVRLGWKSVGDYPSLMLATHINPFRKDK